MQFWHNLDPSQQKFVFEIQKFIQKFLCEFEANKKLISQVTNGATVSLTLKKSFIVCYKHKVKTYHKVNF